MKRYQEKEISVECPKCKNKNVVKANTFNDAIYGCGKCGELIVVKKIEISE